MMGEENFDAFISLPFPHSLLLTAICTEQGTVRFPQRYSILKSNLFITSGLSMIIMPVRKNMPEKEGVYFITFTCAVDSFVQLNF